jgi:hypothetical protein
MVSRQFRPLRTHRAARDFPAQQPPHLSPTWTTWMWIAFIAAAIVLSILGFSLSAH